MRSLDLEDTVICSMTDMTGKKAAETRPVPIPQVGIDVPLRSLIVFLCGLVPAFLMAVFTYLIVGMFSVSILVIGIVEAIVFWFFERRVKTGLRLRTYQAILDERRQVGGVLTLCGIPIDPYGEPPMLIQRSAVLLKRDPRADVEQLFGMYSPHGDPTAASPKKIKKSKANKKKVSKADQDLIADIFQSTGSRR